MHVTEEVRGGLLTARSGYTKHSHKAVIDAISWDTNWYLKSLFPFLLERKRMKSSRCLLQIALACFHAALLLAISLDVQADVSNLIRKFTMDRLELEVQITDETGQPLAGAVVWYVGMPVRPQDGMALNANILSRMAQRYARQSDFLDTSDIPGAVFERTDLQGIYRDFRETGGVPNKLYPYIVVATKRGYIPQVSEGSAPLNQRHVVAFKLQRDPHAQPVPRMEAFDRLLAQARSPVPGEDLSGEARMHKLDELNRQARDLAQTLEKEGLADEASAVYWALADFPEVIRTTSADGKTQVMGYRNGRIDPQSEADRVRATQLNTSVPKLLIDKLLAAQGFSGKGIQDASKGLAYLKIFDKLALDSKGEQVLPHEYDVAIRQALRWGTSDQACDLLQRAYRFEPATMPLKDWWSMLDRLQKRREQLKLPAQICVIEGLAERPSRPQR